MQCPKYTLRIASGSGIVVAMSNVFSPDHYTKMKIEPIDVIESCNLPYNPGSALAYIMRAGHKGDRMSDLKKAMNFLHREIYGTWFVERNEKPQVGDGQLSFQFEGSRQLDLFDMKYIPRK